MIPQIIHYCWFGGKTLPPLVQKCIASWRKYCPGYEIKEWNESNFDVNFCSFAKEAYEAKKWAFLSDCARLKIIYDEGGIYLDTDVEVLKPLDPLLDVPCYLCEETSGFIATGLGFGAEKGSPIIGELLKQYAGHFRLADGVYDVVPCPRKNTEPLTHLGYSFSGRDKWEHENVIVYPPEYFCPMDYETGAIQITENTYTIHHFSALWISEDEKDLNARIQEMEKQNNRLSAFVKRFIMKYTFYKSNGGTKSLPAYILEKIQEKILIKEN